MSRLPQPIGPCYGQHEAIRYVEVPVVKEEVIRVPKKEVYEYEKVVPVYDYEFREKVIEVPQIETVNTEVEVEQVEEVIKRVPVKQRIEVPKEVVKYVTKVVTKVVEKEVEVAGDVVQIPKPFKVENKMIVPRYVTREVPTVVAQVVQPSVRESDTHVTEVVLKEYEPYLIPVDVYLPRPVSRDLVYEKATHRHVAIDVPPSHYNALVKASNIGASDRDVDALLAKQLDGSIPMLNLPDCQVIAPLEIDWKSTHAPQQIHVVASPGQAIRYPDIHQKAATTEASSDKSPHHQRGQGEKCIMAPAQPQFVLPS